MPLSASHRFEAIGTSWSIETSSPLAADVKQAIKRLIDDYVGAYSRFDQQSLVSQMARQAGEYEFPETATKLFSLYDTLYELSDGQVTPLVGALLEDLGYDASYSLQPKKDRRPVQDWRSVKRTGTKLSTTEPVAIDVGAAGKGYLADLVGELMVDHGVTEYVIDASGDIVHRHAEPDIIGLEDPLNPGKVIGKVELKNASLCASAINRRQWGDGLHHIVNPMTGKPTSDVLATWVIAPTGLEADALATALFFVPAEKLAGFQFSYLCLRRDGSVRYDANGNWQLFS